MDCPHCAAPLAETKVEGEDVFSCKGHGLLIPQKTLTAIIEKSWESVPRAQAETRIFEPREDLGTLFPCPSCGTRMDRYPYCGIKAIPIDGCFACRRIWLDKDELETALVAVAKTNYAKRDREATWEKGRTTKEGDGLQGFYGDPRLAALHDPDLTDRSFVRKAVAIELLFNLFF